MCRMSIFEKSRNHMSLWPFSVRCVLNLGVKVRKAHTTLAMFKQRNVFDL